MTTTFLQSVAYFYAPIVKILHITVPHVSNLCPSPHPCPNPNTKLSCPRILPSIWEFPVSVSASLSVLPSTPADPASYWLLLLLCLIRASRKISSNVALKIMYGASCHHHKLLWSPPPYNSAACADLKDRS